MRRDDRDITGKKVRAFYEACSFPGYEGFDSPTELLEKAQRGIYAKLLDEQLPLGVRILDAGCGTGQLAIFLSMMQREVVGIDFSFGSLSKGSNFRKSFDLRHVQFAQMDLFHLALREESFDYVFCNGVLHHTADPDRVFQSLCRLVKPQGYIVLGLYNTYGRLLLDLRRWLFRLTNDKLQWLDFFMRQKSLGSDKKRIWFLDQYKNPHEVKISVGQVLAWFRKNNIAYINSVPKIRLGDRFTANDQLFEPHDPGMALENLFCQLGWALTQGREGGFFVTIGKKTNGNASTA